MALPRNYFQVITLLMCVYRYHGVSGSDIFLLGPTHQNVYAPLDSEQRFNCTGLFAEETSAWLIRLPGSEVTLLFSRRRSQDELNRRQISLNVTQSSGDFATSIVTIRALDINSGIRVQCEITVDGNLSSYSATLIVYGIYIFVKCVLDLIDTLANGIVFASTGPPMAPSDLTVSDVGVQSVNVSWSITEMTIPGVNIRFELTVENLRLSKKIRKRLDLNYYIYNASESASSCDLYRFQVKATNDAGDSGRSETLTTMLPSTPRVNSLNLSLGHYAQKSNEGIEVSISFLVKKIPKILLELLYVYDQNRMQGFVKSIQ